MSAFHVGEWLVEPTLNTLSKSDSTVRLEPKVMQVLVCLAEHPGKVISKDHLLQRVWPGTFVTEDVLTRAISELRHAFGDDPKHPRFIQTIPKGGYRLVAAITRAPDSSDTEAAGAASGTATAREGSARHRRTALLIAVVLFGTLAATALGTGRWLWSESASITGWHALTRSGQVMFPDRYLMHFPGLATDGTRVYFTQGGTGPSWGEKLAQVPVAGGALTIVPTPFRRQILHHMSPDGSRLLVQEHSTALGLDSREGPLWALPLAGEGPLRLGDVVAHAAAWSPDGRQLAFAHQQHLSLAGWDGSHPRRLTSLPGRAYWIRWAPDDSALRFTVTDGAFRTSLWEVQADGTGLHQLLPDWHGEAQPCCGEWSRDGRRFVFLAHENNESSIWLRHESRGFWRTGTGPVRLTSGPLKVGSVIFSRDGRKLLAVSPQVQGTVNRFDLASRSIDPYGIEGVFVRFSPDRRWVTYVHPVSATLWRSRPDGSGALQLTSPPMQAGWPCWSPDGTQIAFSARVPGGSPYKLYLVPSSGGAVRQVIPGDGHEIDPSWSPDGDAIMFGRPPAVMADDRMPKAIYLLNLASGKTTVLSGSEGLFSPRWTSDGRFVVAMPHEKWDRLVRFDFATREWSTLVPYDAANPTLSPNGEWVDFESEHNGRHLARAHLRDGRIERLFDYADVTRGTLMKCGTASSVDLDGSPLLACVVSASDLYVLDLDVP